MSGRRVTERVSGVLERRLRSWISRLIWPEARSHAGAQTVVCHEWIASHGGSDKVAVDLADIADADVIYTFALADWREAMLVPGMPVVTWRFGRWAGRSRRFSNMLPIMPIVWWALDLDRASLVITSSHSCVNAVRTPHASRLSYCHTPMRYAWEWRLEVGRLPAPLRPTLPFAAAVFRRLDRRWSKRVDRYVANSTFVAGRISNAYGVDALVIPPPVDVDHFVVAPEPPPADAAFVTVGRWVGYKRFDLAVAAATAAEVALVVAGGGPDAALLRDAAGAGIEFVEDPTDDEVAALLAGARAFLMCGIEDFGMLPVEAQACGTPVIARGEGGALDSVVAGVTGCFVDGESVDAWAAALADFDRSDYDPEAIRRHAEGFAPDRFRRRVADALDALRAR